MILAVLTVDAPAALGDAALNLFLRAVPVIVILDQLLRQRVRLPVGRAGVEEQQVNLQVQQAGDREEHLLLQPSKCGVQEVHRPVAGIIGDLGEPLDERPLRYPGAAGELRQRLDRQTVGDHREDRPLHRLGLKTPPAARRDDRPADPKALPQPVGQPAEPIARESSTRTSPAVVARPRLLDQGSGRSSAPAAPAPHGRPGRRDRSGERSPRAARRCQGRARSAPAPGRRPRSRPRCAASSRADTCTYKTSDYSRRNQTLQPDSCAYSVSASSRAKPPFFKENRGQKPAATLRTAELRYRGSDLLPRGVARARRRAAGHRRLQRSRRRQPRPRGASASALPAHRPTPRPPLPWRLL